MNSIKDMPVVVRNGIDSVKFLLGKFGKLSDLANQEFWYPSVGNTPEERAAYITWFGEGDFWDDAQTSVRRDFADIYADHLEKHDGVINLEDLQQEWQDFTSGRMSLAKVKEEIELWQAKQFELTENDTISPEEMIVQIREINNTIKPLKEKRTKIEAEYQRRADKRAATKAAKLANATK